MIDEQRLAEVILHAGALDTGERDAYLREVSGEDAALCAEARRRLASAADLGSSFLGRPLGDLFATPTAPTVGDGADDEPVERPPLAPEERYEREGLLGEGGMARVYRARDHQLGRRVALKFLDHPEAAMRRRFLSEARSQARVRHDNVLEVYETGELGGVPYIAMRYVAGQTLLEIRDETPLEEKVRLLALVAEGLHAAHREGLLHRDVKPSNILIEETPDGLKPWVADFGIAAEEDEGVADRAGTPYFMAPERLRSGAAVDRRSDVYSLGVTMYQLFSGALPFDDTIVAEGLRQVLEDEPRSLEETAPDLPAELRAIVMKCLAKEPAERYASARGVAEDLRRYLDGEIVEAYTASLAYRLTRFALRHRTPLTIAVVAAVLLIGLIVAFAWTTSVQAKQIAREAATAERTLSFMTEMFEMSNPFGTEEPDRPRGETVTARELLDRARDRLDRDQELTEDAEVRARLLHTLGIVYRNLGLYEAAESLLEQALALRLETFGASYPDTMASLNELGNIHYFAGQYKLAESLYRRALETRREILGEDHLAVAESLNSLALLLKDIGKLEESESAFRQALAIFRENDEAPSLGSTLSNLAGVLQDQGKLDDAKALFLESLRLRRRVLGDEHPYIATSLNNLAWAMIHQGHYEEAEPLLRESVELYRRLVGENHPLLATSIYNLGQTLLKKGDIAAGEPLIRESLEIRRRVLASDHPSIAFNLTALASLLWKRGDNDAAESLLREGLDIFRRSLGTENPRTATTLNNLGLILMSKGDVEAAEPLLREAVAIYERVAPESPKLAMNKINLARLLVDQQKHSEAHGQASQALDLMGGIYSWDHWRISQSQAILGAALTGLGRHVEAEELLLRSFASSRDAKGEGAKVAQKALKYLVRLYEAWERPEDAKRYRDLLDGTGSPAA